MKFLFLAAVGLAMAAAANPNLAPIQRVYVLPMSNSLDQFLVSRLTRGAIFQVVTDPKQADAILCDHVGQDLDDQLRVLFGDKKEMTDKDKGFATSNGPMQSSRSKGAVFLLDRATRTVLWSDYQHPKSSQPSDINRVADKVATKLEKDKTGKKPE